ncbi:WhiB family transcriptional regulator [Streptomyces sp. NPDC126514]|uniref:WhiB family transcriptional regulator n=1 Tax=Streptomyces sp. NPDC126514 TaxID=3155210 RepID=UPI00332ECAE4
MSRGGPDRQTRPGAGTGEGSRAWEAHAACRQRDADLWFGRRTSATAVAICAACPVLDPCRTAVLQRERGLPRCRRQGVVAGLTGAQRHAMEHRSNRQTPQEPPARRPVGPAAAGVPDGPARERPAPCGTRAAYQRHLRRGESVDEACRAANARDVGRYRRTGSTSDRKGDTRARDPVRRTAGPPAQPN